MSLEWHLEWREAPHSQPTYHSVESERVESVDVIILVEGLVHNKEEEQNWKNNKMTQLKVVDSLIFIFSAIKNVLFIADLEFISVHRPLAIAGIHTLIIKPNF